MANLLKRIKHISIFLAMGIYAHCQNIEHKISFPLLSFQMTNIPQFKNGINKSYFNNFYLPNLRYEVIFNKKMILGFEHYHFNKWTGSPSPEEGEITDLQIRSYSLIAGYDILTSNKVDIKLGTGITYYNSWVTTYLDYYPQWWEGWICYEYNKFGSIFLSTIDYSISKKFFLSLNIRYNPMFKPFERDGYKDCKTLHNHDRLNYGIGQLSIGYKI